MPMAIGVLETMGTPGGCKGKAKVGKARMCAVAVAGVVHYGGWEGGMASYSWLFALVGGYSLWPIRKGLLGKGRAMAREGACAALAGARIALAGARIALAGARIALAGARAALDGVRAVLSLGRTLFWLGCELL
ncbi:unnamed protein product [Closterium sp. NIES-65]|nr:unnamed protein product [Closterium sp. NIES-65]